MAKSGRTISGRLTIPAALGFRSHSGWTAMVALGGPVSSPVILDRRRVELIEAKIPRQPYHASEGLDLPKAGKVIARSVEVATRLASEAIADVLDTLRQRGYQVISSGLVLASGRPLPELAKILTSHALIHTAEGELFRSAIATACESHKLNVFAAKERELPDVARVSLKNSCENIQNRLKEIGKPMGSPWGQDQKLAAIVAWLALSEKGSDNINPA